MSTPKRILMVDDDPDIRALMMAFLASDSYDITEAEDVSVALDALSNERPFDLAILDFWLGKDHAVSITDAITAKGYDLPIIMISGGDRGMNLETTEAIADISGAVKFLQKPFRKSTLLDAVTSALR